MDGKKFMWRWKIIAVTMLIVIAALWVLSLIYYTKNTNNMNEFLQKILGPENTPAIFFSNYFFAVLGAVIFVLAQTATRNPNTPRTPFKFSFAFLTYDNAQRFLLNAILIYVYVRFFSQLFGVALNEWGSLFIGLGFDGLLSRLKKLDIIDKNKNVETFQERKEKLAD